jgi:hypothetical protein
MPTLRLPIGRLAASPHGRARFSGVGGGKSPLHEQSAETWQRIFDVNLRGVAYGLAWQLDGPALWSFCVGQ